MIIGGDIVQRAVAQLSGHQYHFCPVAFSFGWVAYSLSAVLAALGEGRLLPPPDCSCILVNAKNGYVKTVQSWVLSRIVRDHETPTPEPGLTLTFFKASTTKGKAGRPAKDWVFYSGVLTILVQLGIAVIPGVVNNDWNTMIITAGGTVLALAGGALPQWRKEKWNCRPLKKGLKEVLCLTRGNGNKDVIVITCEGEGLLRLEDLATSRDTRDRLTIIATSLLSVLWIVLLLTVAGLQAHAWYMLAIGSLGMVQNGLAAGCRRSPDTAGIHLDRVCHLHKDKVIQALMMAEEIERYVGLSLTSVFFPAGLRENEIEWVESTRARYKWDEKHPASAGVRSIPPAAHAPGLPTPAFPFPSLHTPAFPIPALPSSTPGMPTPILPNISHNYPPNRSSTA